MWGAYCDSWGDPILPPAVLLPSVGAARLDPADEETRSHLFDAADALCLMAFDQHDFFAPHFAGIEPSHAHFVPIGQGFVPGSHWIANTIRGRATTTIDGGYEFTAGTFKAPPDISRQTTLLVRDTSLLSRLNAGWGSELGEEVRGATRWFVRANSRAPGLPHPHQVVLLATALETLVAATLSKAAKKGSAGTVKDRVRRRAAALLGNRFDDAPAGWRDRAQQHHDDWSVFDYWWDDFFFLRNKAAHKGRDARGPEALAKTPSWSMAKHLLLGTLVFPLLVRAALVRKEEGALADSELEVSPRPSAGRRLCGGHEGFAHERVA